MEPFWVQFPDLHPFSIGWRMGPAESARYAFWDWWTASDEARTEESRIEFVRSWPMRPCWSHVAIEMIWPDEVDPELMVFFEDDHVEQRRRLFAKAKAIGLSGEDEWLRDLDDAAWGDQ